MLSVSGAVLLFKQHACIFDHAVIIFRDPACPITSYVLKIHISIPLVIYYIAQIRAVFSTCIWYNQSIMRYTITLYTCAVLFSAGNTVTSKQAYPFRIFLCNFFTGFG